MRVFQCRRDGELPAGRNSSRSFRGLQYAHRIPLPHSALPGGFVLPCSSVRLIRYYRTADDAEEDFYAHF